MCVCMVVFPCTNAYLYLCLYQYVSYLREDRRSYENENKTVRYSQIWASQVAHWVKNPLAMQETRVQFLGLEDPLDEGMAIHSSILAWRLLLDREAWQTAAMGLQRVENN